MQLSSLKAPTAKLRALIVGPGRRRLPRTKSVRSFFATLNAEGCKYVVLRWFESLPVVADREDIDLLVSDEHAPLLDRVLTRVPIMGGIPVDVYSVTGLPSFSHRGIAYYPPHVAAELLGGATKHPSGARVPNDEDYFKSLAFHALYHKGYRSGLPKGPDLAAEVKSPEHDYAGELAALSRKTGIRAGISLHELDHYLAGCGWRPSLDALAKLGQRNRWCREIVGRELAAIQAPKGLCAFVVRETARSQIKEIERLIAARGFRLVAVRALEGPLQETVKSSVRGGNWGRGPFPMSGGPPAVVIAAVDPEPVPPSADLAEECPEADNARVFELKYALRTWWNERHSPSEHCNPVHSSDSARHAVHYMRIAGLDDAIPYGETADLQADERGLP
jgi:hypothetical protein